MILAETKRFIGENKLRFSMTVFALIAVGYLAFHHELPHYDSCGPRVSVVDPAAPFMPASQAADCFINLDLDERYYPKPSTVSSAAGDTR